MCIKTKCYDDCKFSKMAVHIQFPLLLKNKILDSNWQDNTNLKTKETTVPVKHPMQLTTGLGIS